jgi:hypothetical protein
MDQQVHFFKLCAMLSNPASISTLSHTESIKRLKPLLYLILPKKGNCLLNRTLHLLLLFLAFDHTGY